MDMAKERNFCFILIFLSFICTIRTQFEMTNEVSHDKEINDFLGCHCHYTFDSSSEQEVQIKLEKLETKIDRIEESIFQLTQLTEILLNNTLITSRNPISMNTESGANLKIKEEKETMTTVNELDEFSSTISTLSLSVDQLKEDSKFANRENAVFDENFNCIENCELTPETPQTCDEIMSNVNNTDGVYLLRSNYLQPFGAYCTRFDKHGWTIIQRRQDGSENFYRNWSDYKNGFGNLSGNYWLGLDRIHIMTSMQSSELYVYWESRENTEGFAHYSSFYVDDEDQGYKLTARGFSGSADDGLLYYNGNKFSTFVEEGDQSHSSLCAEQTKSAWWYNRCDYNWRYASLNGEYRPYTSDGKGIYWWSYNQYHSLKYVFMAIRPI